MTYPTRRSLIEAERIAQRSRTRRHLTSGAASVAAVAGLAFTGMAPASANDAAYSTSGSTQQSGWSYSGTSAQSTSERTGYARSTTARATAAGQGGVAASRTAASSTGTAQTASTGLNLQRTSSVTSTSVVGSGANATAAQYAAAKASSASTYYRYGGVGPTGFDCSGLTMQAMAAAGKSIPRTSSGQYAGASQYVSLDNLQVGDLVFWSNNGSGSGVYHVAMYIGNGQIAHARNPSSGVSITAVDYSPNNMLGVAARY